MNLSTLFAELATETATACSPDSAASDPPALDPQTLTDRSIWPGSAIFHRARQLVGHAGLNLSDLDDLRQELVVHVLTQWPKFDPLRASARTFIDRILRQRQAAILRQRRAAAYRAITSSWVGEINQDRRRPETPDPFTSIDRRHDVGHALAGLSTKQRKLAAGLMSHTVSDLARRQKKHRQRLYESMRHIRQRMEDVGLREYVR